MYFIGTNLKCNAEEMSMFVRPKSGGSRISCTVDEIFQENSECSYEICDLISKASEETLCTYNCISNDVIEAIYLFMSVNSLAHNEQMFINNIMLQ